MKRKKTVPLLCGILAVLGLTAGLLLQNRSAPTVPITTEHISSEISGAELRAYLSVDTSYASDSQFTQADQTQIDTLLDEQVLYKETVTRNYGDLFSIIFTAYYTDAERTQCVLSHLEPLSARVIPLLDSVDFVTNTTGDVWGMFCRYAIRGIAPKASDKRVLRTLSTVEKGQMFKLDDDIFYGSDVILYQQNYSVE